ncbi:MAG: hypothetical protein SFW36_04960 [Leptolyngbyaceae cyanobacterium bins.59]|nr:hypothetical protein [Leptolyngbyaceae cyanobacterium bins.59]
MVSKLRSFALFCLPLLLACLIFPGNVYAAKKPKALIFDQPGRMEVAVVYETAFATQKGTVKALKLVSKSMKKAMGFQGSATLKSQDGKQVIVLSQWQDAASYQTYATTAATTASKTSIPSETTPGMTTPPVPARTLVLQLEKAQPSIAGTIPALRGKEAVVHLSRWTAKSPEFQPEVLAQVEAMIPSLLATQPVPQSVLLLKAIETGEVALWRNWNCSALFEDVGVPTALIPDKALAALADSEQLLYDVVNLIPVEEKKVKADEEKA